MTTAAPNIYCRFNGFQSSGYTHLYLNHIITFMVRMRSKTRDSPWNNPDYENWFKTYTGKEIDIDRLHNYYPYEYKIETLKTITVNHAVPETKCQ